MKKRLVLNDIKNNKLLSVSTFIFMFLSALLIALTCVLFTGLIGAVDALMDKALTPDFLQMHAGDIDEGALLEFAEKDGDVLDYQTLVFLNFSNSDITINGQSLADSTQDNGLCTQSGKFDYLLGMDNELLNVNKGEIYIPVCYRREYRAEAGQTVQLGQETFTIAGFLRDSQMTSMMSSSKRFLVNSEDFERLTPQGSGEYLIEFLLKDGADANAFATRYADSGLPANGPAITRPLIRVMNALSDGMMILVILLVSIVMVLISRLCIRFTLLAKMEADKREIGLLKAVGIPRKEIRQIYFLKYVVLSGGGALMGLIVSYIVKGPLQVQMQELYGVSDNAGLSFIISLIGVVITEGVLLLSVNSLLKQTEKMNAIEALNSSGKDTKSAFSQYALISFVIAAGVFLMTVPQNLKSTVSAKSFVTYMGIGDGEIRVDIRQTEDILSQTKKAEEIITNDGNVSRYVSLLTKNYRMTLPDGTVSNVNVEQGDHTLFPVAYASGSAPVNENEIAFSNLLADDLKVQTGSSVTIDIDGTERVYTVSGVYSDITSGGKTAKSAYTDDNAPVMWSVFYINLTDSVSREQWLSDFEGKLAGENISAKCSDLEDFVKGIYGQTIEQIKNASAAAIAASAAVIITVVYLFVCLIAAKDRNEISLRKAIGIRSGKIKTVYYKRIAAAALAGIAAGILLGNIPGEAAAGMMLSSVGAAGFKFVIDPLAVYAVIPLITAAAVFIPAAAGLREINGIKAFECCVGRE